MTDTESTAPSAAKNTAILSLLKRRDFRTLWLAQAVSWSGDHFTYLALMIVINKATGSAAAIALLMIVMTVPSLLFGMLAGVLVDRWDRKQVMVVSDVARGVLTLALIWAATPEHIWMIYPLAFVMASVGVFFGPARGAVMKTILAPDELLPANILMQVTFRVTLVVGPALAGVMIGVFGPAPAFAFDGITFLMASALVATMVVARLVRSDSESLSGRSAFWHDFREGLAFIGASPTISGLLLVMTVISLATGAINALFVPFMMNVLNVGATAIGLADSAQGVGLIGGALVAAAVQRLRPNLIIAGGLILASIVIIAIGLAPTFYVVLVLMLLIGLVIGPIEATIPALMQKIVPLDKMGRVGGTMNTSQSVATLASMGIAGVLADAVGIRLIFVVAGAIGILAGIIAISAIREESPAQQDGVRVQPSLRPVKDNE